MGPGRPTTAEQVCALQFCEFFGVCDQRWRDDDSLIFIPGIRRGEQDALDIGGVITLAASPRLDGDVAGIRPQRQHWLVRQAALQVQARLAAAPVAARADRGRRRCQRPRFRADALPDDGDVFLDSKATRSGVPAPACSFYSASSRRDEKGTWAYRDWWAHNIEESRGGGRFDRPPD